MQIIIALGFYTIWFTPMIFVSNLIGAMKAVKKGEETAQYTIACSISLMFMVIPLFMAMLY